MRHARLLPLLLLLSSCAAGVQQAMVLPWVRGNWSYSGTDFVARDAAGGKMPVHIGGDSGTLNDLGTVTQILLAMDLPFMRASFAPALTTSNNVEFIQADLLYKHLLIDEPGRRWWLLGGLGLVVLNSGVSLTTHPSQNTMLNGRTVTPDDTINYTARRDTTGTYAAIGAQMEITGWCHAYGELLVRLGHTEHQVEQMELQGGANGPAINLSTPPAGLTVDRQLQATVQSEFDAPVILLNVGVHFNLPSYRIVRHVVRWQSGDPALDDALPELPEDVTPGQQATPGEEATPTAQ
jgi:hypothetical protein